MSAAKVKQIIGIVLLTAFMISLGWKIYDSFAHRSDGAVIMFFLFLVLIAIVFAVAKILRY